MVRVVIIVVTIVLAVQCCVKRVHVWYPVFGARRLVPVMKVQGPVITCVTEPNHSSSVWLGTSRVVR